MADIEKVIKVLEYCVLSDDCRPCEYWMEFDDTGCQIMKDALALLKEQEAEPLSHMTDDSDLYFTCGKCGHVIWSEDYKFCPMCATRIAWNGERSVKRK